MPEVPVTPFEVSENVDLNHPSEWSREPSRVPQRSLKRRLPCNPEVEQRTKPKGLAPRVRRLRWPELFWARYSVCLIQSQRQAHAPPRDVDVAVDEIIATGVPEDQRRKFVVTMHPGFRRWALFELVQNPKHGPAYYCISIFSTGGRPGVLPEDLETPDRRWAHLEGRVGNFRVPTRRDFEIIRNTVDRRLMTPDQMESKLMEEARLEYNEKNRVENDFVEDMLDYNFLRINTAANGGRKQYVVPEVERRVNEGKFYVEQRNGYKIIARKRPLQDLGATVIDLDATRTRRRLEASAAEEARIRAMRVVAPEPAAPPVYAEESVPARRG